MDSTFSVHTQPLADLFRRQAVSDVVIRYASGLDSRDWAAFASCFADPVTIDFSSFSRGPANVMTRDAWVKQVRGLIPGFVATQHLSTNHVVDLSGTRARAVSQMQATHYLPGHIGGHDGDPLVTLGGHYTNDLVETETGWVIERCELTVKWRAGNEGLWALAAARAAAGPGVDAAT